MKASLGIIPAHAGLTNSQAPVVIISRDHPRACGAHQYFLNHRLSSLGSSPRMRGSHYYQSLWRDEDGIIPAHAGLTILHHPDSVLLWDHPRACGAHRETYEETAQSMGSSPRMRGSLLLFYDNRISIRIIPAHAGLTCCSNHRAGFRRDHPRACGAHWSMEQPHMRSPGSSPRMRGSLCIRRRKAR